MSRLLAAGIAVSLFVAGVFASGSSTAAVTPENPYAGLYAKSVAGMTAPDQSLARVIAPDAEFGFAGSADPAPQSKTCSQRCSTTCSKGCTTTRGCSSTCKRQSDGCGGATTPPTTRPPATETVPAIAAVLPAAGSAGALQTRDLRARTITNAQRVLAFAGYDGFCLDGTYSAGFSAALKDFQTRNNIAAVGILTEMTWLHIDSLLTRAGVQ